MITLSHITACYRTEVVLHDLSLHIGCGEMVAVVGPNGAGKSSLLRVITGILPAQGTALVAGTEVQRLNPRARARLLSVVPQDVACDIPYTAYDFVLLGRTASLPRFGGPAPEDRQAVQEALTLTETWHLRQRPLPEMSGGERQRLALAMALASRPKIILLDEPTSHLDLRHRSEMMHLLTRLNLEQQMTILMVVHDLTLASQFFNRIVLLSAGCKIADGPVVEVMTPEALESAYGCPVSVFPLPGTPASCVLSKL
jgi:iron complex transport system ATP-binding protein